MKTHRLVLPEDLNQFGFMFGGRLLSWVDEVSWIAASMEYPICHFVTVGLDDVSFRHSIHEGSILEFESTKMRQGSTSITYHVSVRDGRDAKGEVLFSTEVTFVNVSKDGAKVPIPSKS